MNWITDLEQYVAEREPEIPITMFQDEIPVESLLGGWQSDKDGIHHVLGLISSYTDKKQLSEDDPTYYIFSHLDMLQHT
ncbi:MAG: hypothetical protein HC887_09165, partial [Desulfobacteraceae bacterium]|nr:hypothetical protein [Desulfobacteraceae bacterium]